MGKQDQAAKHRDHRGDVTVMPDNEHGKADERQVLVGDKRQARQQLAQRRQDQPPHHADAGEREGLLSADVDVARARNKKITFKAGEFEVSPWLDRRPATYRL